MMVWFYMMISDMGILIQFFEKPYKQRRIWYIGGGWLPTLAHLVEHLTVEVLLTHTV
jgi:hypothetical protein